MKNQNESSHGDGKRKRKKKKRKKDSYDGCINASHTRQDKVRPLYKCEKNSMS